MQRTKKKISNDFKAFCMIQGPFLLWWIILSVFPITFGLALGFFEWKDLQLGPQFVGFENYVRFFSDPDYLNALWTAIWLGLVCSLTLLISAQAFLHMFINVDLGPLTGQTLPLVSHGKGAFLSFCVAFGIILSISRMANKKIREEEAKWEQESV